MASNLHAKLFAAVAFSALALTACSQSETEMADASHDMEGMDHSNMEGMDHSGHAGMEMANESTPVGHGADYAENFRLIDQNGESHELYYHKDADAVVIMTAGNGCPIVRGAVPDLKKIREDYADKDVVFYLLNSNLHDTREDIKAEAEEFGYDFDILKDENQLVGEQLNFDRTAQVYVINPKEGFKVEYYGPLNDRQTYERQRPVATETYVRDVLDSVIAGEEVTTEAPAIRAGCMINFPERKKKA